MQQQPMTMSLSSHAASDSLPPSPSSTSSHSHYHPQRHFSEECRQFSGAALKKLATPDPNSAVIPLGAGRPSPDLLPWNCRLPQSSSSSSTKKDNDSPSSQLVLLQGSSTYPLSAALDYGYAEGAPQLLRFVREHVTTIHRPPHASWTTCLSSGSTAALETGLRILCDRGDVVLAERHTYPGFLEVAGLLGLEVLGVDMDEGGIVPAALRKVLLSTSRTGEGGKKRPRVLYTIPSGQNPTGATQTVGRKREVYAVAEEFDVVIIEDDPYYFLQLGEEESQESFAARLIPSYLSLDTAGRVIRLDSASKILAPGLRIGWVTAHEDVVAKFAAYHEISTAFPSGPAQLMLYNLLCKEWGGHAGFLGWLAGLSARYGTRRGEMLRACEMYLPSDSCTWDVPSRGMFVWVRVDTRGGTRNGPDLEQDIMARALDKGVQVTNGSLFESSSSSASAPIYFRLSFAAVWGQMLARGVEAFAAAVREGLGM